MRQVEIKIKFILFRGFLVFIDFGLKKLMSFDLILGRKKHNK